MGNKASAAAAHVLKVRKVFVSDVLCFCFASYFAAAGVGATAHTCMLGVARMFGVAGVPGIPGELDKNE